MAAMSVSLAVEFMLWAQSDEVVAECAEIAWRRAEGEPEYASPIRDLARLARRERMRRCQECLMFASLKGSANDEGKEGP